MVVRASRVRGGVQPQPSPGRCACASWGGRCPWIAPGIDGDRQDGKRYPLPNPRLTPFTGEERPGFPDGDRGEDLLIRLLRIGGGESLFPDHGDRREVRIRHHRDIQGFDRGILLSQYSLKWLR